MEFVPTLIAAALLVVLAAFGLHCLVLLGDFSNKSDRARDADRRRRSAASRGSRRGS